MMQPENLTLTAAQWTEAVRGRLHINASDLGLKAGEWPTRITLPYGPVLKPLISCAECVVYSCAVGTQLTIWDRITATEPPNH